MCIKILCFSTETYLRYYVKGGNLGRYFHESSASRIGTLTKKVVIDFAMYQRMRSKRTYWDGTRLIVEVVKGADYWKVPIISILLLELYHYVVPIAPIFHVGQGCALNKVKGAMEIHLRSTSNDFWWEESWGQWIYDEESYFPSKIFLKCDHCSATFKAVKWSTLGVIIMINQI